MYSPHDPRTLQPPHEPHQDFERQAEQSPPGLVGEFWDFLIHNKKWWITPIVVICLLLGGLLALSGSAAAPFIYTLW
jgi:hypothetical protein